MGGSGAGGWPGSAGAWSRSVTRGRAKDGRTSARREEVKHVLRRPADEARLHLARVEKSFQLLGAESECSACPAMSGLQLQAQATLARADESLFDVVILAGAVEAEHYEIGVYET